MLFRVAFLLLSIKNIVCLFVCLFIPFNILCKSKTIVGQLGHLNPSVAIYIH